LHIRVRTTARRRHQGQGQDDPVVRKSHAC
jgi:hypothetical protein